MTSHITRPSSRVDNLKPFWGNVLGGSWDLVSKVISTLSGLISNCKYIVTVTITPVNKSHDPLSSLSSRTERVHVGSSLS